MCNSNQKNVACCPPAQIIQEEICGNFNGPLAGAEVWSAPSGDYIQGTFQVFNSAASTGNVSYTITRSDNVGIADLSTPGKQ